MLVEKKLILLGKGAKLDKSSIVGYKPIRKIKKLNLKIGSGLSALAGSIIYAGSVIGKNTIVGHNTIIREENIIGNNFSVWNNSVVDYGCSIGNNVKIHCNVYVAQFTTIEDDVFIAPGVTIANDIHPKCEFSIECMRGPIIRQGAIIGVNVTINPFVVIGKKTIIGAGSVVTKDIPDEKVAYGNPAKIISDKNALQCITGITDFPYKAR